jgi:hypothetical protein
VVYPSDCIGRYQKSPAAWRQKTGFLGHYKTMRSSPRRSCLPSFVSLTGDFLMKPSEAGTTIAAEMFSRINNLWTRSAHVIVREPLASRVLTILPTTLASEWSGGKQQFWLEEQCVEF